MVDILMATYNGARYIETQILSIISQSFNDWLLIIHDDGSLDDTVDIVRRWSSFDKRIKIIDDGIRCGGAAQNFMHLLKYSESEYVMFCDQDDVWFDNKVDLMLRKIESMDSVRPRVVYSNSYVWFPNEGVKGLSTLFYASSMNELLFMNSGIQGCVSIFDCKVRDILKEYDGEMSMHDHLLHLVAVSLADVSFMPIPLMLYRNHELSVTGTTRTRLLNEDNLLHHGAVPVVDILHYKTVKNFKNIYKKRLSTNDYKIIDSYLSMRDMSYCKRLLHLFKYRFKLYNSIIYLALKITLRPYCN